MLPIVDKSIIQFTVEEALESGLEEILIITGLHKRPIEDHFDSNFELEEVNCAANIAVIEVPKTETDKYGITDVDQEVANDVFIVLNFVEKPQPDEAPNQ